MPDDIKSSPPPGSVYEVLTAGESLGEYTIEACLSYDILGSLYRVSTPTEPAKTLFVLPRILSNDENFMRRFNDLKSRLKSLSHPSILGLGESVEIAGRICFTAEAIAGKSIPDYLGAAGIYPTYKNPQGVVRAHPSEESKNFTPEKIARVAHTMLEALAHAHAKSTLHLNLTPSNVILTEDGGAKVVGFGLYSIIGQSAIETLVSAGIPAVSLGPRNVRLNTADIIAPEVHLKQEPDERTDIYAFGMSVYWMLTGLKPSANYRPPSGIVPGLEPGWDIFLTRCLAREKHKRYANAEIALKELENLSRLTTAGFSNDPERLKIAARKTRRKIIFASTLAALAAVIGTLTFSQLTDSEADDQVPAGSPYVRADTQQPVFIFTTKTPGVRVIATRNNASFAMIDGELSMTAPAGRSRFSLISEEGSRTLTLNNAGTGAIKVPIRFSRTTGAVEITTTPNSVVYLEAADKSKDCLGTTDPSGVLSATGIPTGDYTIIVEKPKSPQTRSPDFTVRSQGKAVRNVVTEGQTCSLSLQSSPDGADISINGNDAGTTPMTIDKLKPGTRMTIVFSKPNYRPVTKTIVVGGVDKMTLDSGPMPPCKGMIEYALTFSGNPPTAEKLAGLTLARNDDRFTKRDWTAAQKLPKEVPVGHYMLKVDHPDYEPFQTAFKVEDAQVTKVSVGLRATPSPLNFSISPRNINYQLRINNTEYQNRAPSTVPADIPLEIEIEARDYQTWKMKTVGLPRRPLTVAASLKRLAPPEIKTAFTVPYLGINMVWVPAGTTRLGSPGEERGHTSVEEPYTWAVFDTGYWMSTTEITQEEFERVLGYNPSRVKDPKKPVDSVTYVDALRFCRAINRREIETGRLPFGYEYRLPNELEWEYACRAGTETPFSFGDTATTEQGNFLGEYPPSPTTSIRPDKGVARKVASYAPNKYGLFDMHGNVREWVIEQYKPHLPGGRRIDYNVPTSMTESPECTTRGGSYRMSATESRSAWRPLAPVKPSDTADDLGFRIVLAPSPLP